MGLTHAVITSVDRDDLEDGGATHFGRNYSGGATSRSPIPPLKCLPQILRAKLARLKLSLMRPQMFLITIWKPCRVYTQQYVPVPGISPLYCC